MGTCCEAWQVANSQMETVLANSLRRDVAEFSRLCDALLAPQQPISPVAPAAN